jgi:hypothetical protein
VLLCLDRYRPGGRFGRFPDAAFQNDLILTLFVTLLLEGAVVSGYCVWRKKPLQPLLFSSICINLFTQSLLWIVLSLFFRQYLITLIIAEFLIWMGESVLFYSIRGNRLHFKTAPLLSFAMNLASFGVGWFLPV